ncbi:hypothetical protein BHE74_00043658 [Ensete ventricosum]|nr:hypothetical protein BHE74_00043658 [Ensete ventricosum]
MVVFAVLWSHAVAALAPSCLGTVLGGVRRGPRRDRQAHPWHLNVHRRGCDPGRIRSLRFHATSSAAAVSRGSGRRHTCGTGLGGSCPLEPVHSSTAAVSHFSWNSELFDASA